jgi:hypothetical protein
MKKVVILILLVLVSCRNEEAPENPDTATEEVVQVTSTEEASQKSTEKEVPEKHQEEQIITVPASVHGYPELSGIWVNKQFDSRLRITKSFIKNGKPIKKNDSENYFETPSYHLMWLVYFDSSGIRIVRTNYHDGNGIAHSRFAFKGMNKDCFDNDYCLELINDSLIRVTAEEGSWDMVKYSNLDTTVARNHELHLYGNSYICTRTVAGKYRDSKGKLYEFKAKGEAIFTEYSFEYEIPFSGFYHWEVARENDKSIDEYFKRNNQFINAFHPLSLKPIKGKLDFKELGYYWRDGLLYIVKDWDTSNPIKLEVVDH